MPKSQIARPLGLHYVSPSVRLSIYTSVTSYCSFTIFWLKETVRWILPLHHCRVASSLCSRYIGYIALYVMHFPINMSGVEDSVENHQSYLVA